MGLDAFFKIVLQQDLKVCLDVVKIRCKGMVSYYSYIIICIVEEIDQTTNYSR
ncbi:unnamed protein product [Brugia timori]|uniref:Uncharacterized protein n=1 Tax=Brugia timori TaxID=42155 RepID=A0A0R3QRF2_9BILA|nr:unnamed protein product [Brugia timori]